MGPSHQLINYAWPEYQIEAQGHTQTRTHIHTYGKNGATLQVIGDAATAANVAAAAAMQPPRAAID